MSQLLYILMRIFSYRNVTLSLLSILFVDSLINQYFMQKNPGKLMLAKSALSFLAAPKTLQCRLLLFL